MCCSNCGFLNRCLGDSFVLPFLHTWFLSSGTFLIFAAAQVASLDLNGLIKVWDVRTFGCLHTIQCKAQERDKVFKTEQVPLEG